jgi:hypothetical protein
MSEQQRKHLYTEHIWRAIRASLLFLAMLIWIAEDGISVSDMVVIGLVTVAHLTEQFHGFICNRIERLFGWKEDFEDWE